MTQNKIFPLPPTALNAFEILKKGIENSIANAIDEEIPFVIETDASDYTISATLNQAGRPVAFFSRTLEPSEQHHSSVEKHMPSLSQFVHGGISYLEDILN